MSKFSSQRRKAISAAWTPAMREAVGAAVRGRRLSAETKQRMSLSAKRKWARLKAAAQADNAGA